MWGKVSLTQGDEVANFSFELDLVLGHGLLSHERIAVGIGFDLGPVAEIVLEFGIARRYQLLEDLTKDAIDEGLQALAPQTVDCAEVRRLAGGQPHEGHLFPKGLGYLP